MFRFKGSNISKTEKAMSFKFSPQIANRYSQLIYKNQGPKSRDKKVLHNQTEKCLIINNFFPTGSKKVIFSMSFILILNNINTKNKVKICFGFGHIVFFSVFIEIVIFSKLLKLQVFKAVPSLD